VTYTYQPGTGNVSGVSGPGGETLAFTYDGPLVTGLTWSGEVAGTVTAGYNSSLQLSQLSVNGGAPIALAYDSDGLLSQAGGLTINRSVTNGLISGTSLGVASDSLSYTALGEIARKTVSTGGTPIFDVTYNRDSLGRVSEVNETLSGASTTKTYNYDPAGRLAEVRENGALAAMYEYDLNGNRLRVTRPAGIEVASYDGQDRLATYGTATYTYTRSGELSTKVASGDTTHYEYDVLGNLRRVTRPDASVIEYVLDGMNRRVGKKVNGVLVQGWLYQERFNPVAELDGSGAVVKRFVYATRPEIPDYVITGGGTYRIIADVRGSIRLVVNVADGVVAQQISYDEFGRLLTNSNPGFQPFGYAGGLGDDATGLLRFGTRDYDPVVGRFTTKDHAAFGGGTNVYEYAAGDPLSYSDPSGTCPAYAGGDGLTPTAFDCPPEVLGEWSESHISFDGVSSFEGDPQVLTAVVQASVELDEALNISSIRRLPDNPNYKDNSLHSRNPSGAVDINMIGSQTVSELVKLGCKNLLNRAQKTLEKYLGKDLYESFGPYRFYKPNLGGIFSPSPGLWTLHQTHIHVGVKR